mgnify:CR=1 FL=1
MKKIVTILIFTCLFACEADPVFEPDFFDCDISGLTQNPSHPRSTEFQNLIDGIRDAGTPGIMMSVRDKTNGVWSGVSGKADLKCNIDLLPCNITRVGSTVKTFTAVSIFMLIEEGKLGLDDPITMYLSDSQLLGLENAHQSTVKDLLQHTSGIFNYIRSLRFQTASLNDLNKTWYPEDLMAYARGASALFPVGTDADYSNTNYILLGQIIESITKKPFYVFFEQRIFIPFGLTMTQFAATDPVPAKIIQGYTDLYNNRTIINSTQFSGWDYFTADGGLISNPYDLALFMEQLFGGKILKPESLIQMLDWTSPSYEDPEGFPTDYGLGIFKIETSLGTGYIHSGDAIGYFASMVYFPEYETVISWAANGNYGSIDEHTQSKSAMEHIFKTILE